MTLEQIIPMAAPIFIIALIVGIGCEVAIKPILDGTGLTKEAAPYKRAVYLNLSALALSIAAAWLWAAIDGTVLTMENKVTVAAIIIVQGIFATGVAILGYEGLTNMVKMQRGG